MLGERTTPAVKEKNLKKLEQKYHKNSNKENWMLAHMGIELYRLAEEQLARVPQAAALTGWRRYSHGGCWENVERDEKILTGNL